MMTQYESVSNYAEIARMASEEKFVSDFTTQRFLQYGEYANFATVAESGTYPTVTTPGDIEETGSLIKKGGIEDITFEATRDPDGARLSVLPQRMGSAMGRTFREYLIDLITTTGQTMNDGVALYHSGSHSNTDTDALSLAAVIEMQQNMWDQTAAGSSKKLGEGNPLKFVLVPHGLVATAKRIIAPSAHYATNVPTRGRTPRSTPPISTAPGSSSGRALHMRATQTTGSASPIRALCRPSR